MPFAFASAERLDETRRSGTSTPARSSSPISITASTSESSVGPTKRSAAPSPTLTADSSDTERNTSGSVKASRPACVSCCVRRTSGAALLSRAQHAHGIEIRQLSREPALELSAQFVRRAQTERRIVHVHAPGRGGDRAIQRSKRLPEQRIVVVDATPAFPVERVRRVELRGRVARGRVGAGEREPGFPKPVLAEIPQPLVECRLVDPVEPDAGCQAAADVRQRPWLRREQPGREGGGAERR